MEVSAQGSPPLPPASTPALGLQPSRHWHTLSSTPRPGVPSFSSSCGPTLLKSSRPWSVSRSANYPGTEMNNTAQPLLARTPSTLIPGPLPCWPRPLPITVAGLRVRAEALLAEWCSAEVWVPGPWPPCLRVQAEAMAVLLRGQHRGRGRGEAGWVLGPALL